MPFDPEDEAVETAAQNSHQNQDGEGDEIRPNEGEIPPGPGTVVNDHPQREIGMSEITHDDDDDDNNDDN